MVVEDEVDRHTMAATDKSRTGGTEVVLTVVEPPQVGAVWVEPEITNSMKMSSSKLNEV